MNDPQYNPNYKTDAEAMELSLAGWEYNDRTGRWKHPLTGSDHPHREAVEIYEYMKPERKGAIV